LFAPRIHLPAFLRSTPVTTLPSSYEGSDSSTTSAHCGGLPDSPTRTSDRSVSKHPRSSSQALSALCSRLALRAGPFPVCIHHGSGFAHRSQARQLHRPNRVPLVRTGRSPPVAPHPVSRRRSYGRLQSKSFDRKGLSPSRPCALSGARAGAVSAPRRIEGRPGAHEEGRFESSSRRIHPRVPASLLRRRRDAARSAGGTPALHWRCRSEVTFTGHEIPRSAAPVLPGGCGADRGV